MISRFNLDQKRLTFYDDIEEFNKNFIINKSTDNTKEFLLEISKPTVLINNEKSIKLTIIKNSKNYDYILFSNHSISLLPLDTLKIHKALKDISKFDIYYLKDL